MGCENLFLSLSRISYAQMKYEDLSISH